MVALFVAAAVAALAALLGTKVLIRWLGARAVHQPILSTSEGGPGHEAKAGTPTMGGMAIVGAACVGYGIAHLRSGVIFTRSGLFVMLAMIGAGVVGFLDDWIKVSNARNLGLSKRTKMIGLLVVSIGFIVLYLGFTNGSTNLGFTRFDHPGIELGDVGWSLLAVFMILATTNAVNLTDGLDGLASGSAILSFAAFVVTGFWAFRHPEVYASATRAGPGRRRSGDARRLRGLPLVERRARVRSSWVTPARSPSVQPSRAWRCRRTPSCC